MPLDFDWTVLAGLLVCALPWAWMIRRRRAMPLPLLGFSHLMDLTLQAPTWRVRFAALPRTLHYFGLLMLAVAFCDPRIPLAPSAAPPPGNQEPESKLRELPTEGVAVYLVLDQSGSMAREATVKAIDGTTRAVKRIDLLKKVTHDFIAGNPELGLEGRPNDLIGLVQFARVAEVLSPLTLDHRALLEQLRELSVVKNPDRDGTAIGYALYKTVSMILATRHFAEQVAAKGTPSYSVKSQLIILVTDGFEEPNPKDQGNALRNMKMEEAAQYAADNHVAIYIVNVEPSFARPELTSYRKKFTEAAEKTGGAFFVMTDRNPLHEIYKQIDKMEKSKLPVGRKAQTEITQKVSNESEGMPVRWQSIARLFVGLGLAALALGSLLETTVLRRVP